MINTVQFFLSYLDQLDIKVWIEGERLRCNAPKGVLNDEILGEIKQRKEEIIQFLQDRQNLFIESKNQLIPKLKNRENLPLSFAQQRLWFLDQLEGSNATYNMPGALCLEGELNQTALRDSLNTIIARHEVLRTRFETRAGNPVQIISSGAQFNLELIDLQELSTSEQEQQVREKLQAEAEYTFELSEESLIRGKLLQLTPQKHLLIINMHHIISDGWSIGILVEELSQLYEAYSQGKPSPLPELAIQYADFAVWQREWLRGENLDKQLDYWKEKLAGLPPLLELPTDKPRPPIQSFRGKHREFKLSVELSEQLKQLSQEQGVTLFMTLLSAYSILLHRYSRQGDIAIGSPIANRNRGEIEPLIGFFVNTLVLRIELEDNPKYVELLEQVRQTCLEAYGHQDVPFEKLVEELQPERNMSHTPLFQAMFVLQNNPMEPLALSGLTISPVEIEWEIAKFDLTLSMVETESGLAGQWEYNTDLWEEETIERMMGHFEMLLSGIVAQREQKVGELPLLREEEKEQILVEWNKTEADYPRDKCIHQLFEEQVERTPDAIAVVYENQQLTYRELNERANQLAHYLVKLGVKPDDLVGICVERSQEMVVGLLGILKSGGAYVPIDPHYPSERIEYMLSDSQTKILLTQIELISQLPEYQGEIIDLDKDWARIAAENEENLSLEGNSSNLAYVIYTSGSTGKPKGVMVKHQGLCNLSQAQIQLCHVTSDSKVLQFASFSFDACIWEVVMALVSGASLYLTSRDGLLPGIPLTQVLQQYPITHITLPPSALTVMSPDQLETVETIIVAGEHCPQQLAAQWSKVKNLLNGYGPTESTVCTTIGTFLETYNKFPIGKPLPNIQVYILDQNWQPVPVGVPGELHIGGDGLARGYLNRPELTAEKFIPHPFSEEPDARLYKTGDLCRYLPDGNIEYLGRIDYQVKIRGFRIELGEIESRLSSHPQVKETVVIAREDQPGDKRLVAYLVSNLTAENIENQTELTPILRQYLGEQLPDYMIPSAFVWLEQLPLTPNGKVDRKVLPAPDHTNVILETEFVSPRTPTEEILVTIWAEVLGVEKVGIHNDFFHLGGHSLSAVRVISQVRDAFQLEISLRSIFESSTIAELAKTIDLEKDQGSEQSAPSITRVSRRTRRIKLSEIQSN